MAGCGGPRLDKARFALVCWGEAWFVLVRLDRVRQGGQEDWHGNVWCGLVLINKRNIRWKAFRE